MDLEQTFDVIVVGSGSAGAIVAARLSEDPARHVLLVEAGRDWQEAPPYMKSANPLAIILPPDLQALWQWPALMATRTRQQQPRLYWRGRGLGGSSAMNAQIAIRGVSDAFDQWAAAGCAGWSFADLLPLMKRIENDPTPGDWHGQDGPVPVYSAPRDRWGPVDAAFCDAALAAGYAWNPDLNAPIGEGVSCYPINNRDGVRVSTNEAYLAPARHRPNLTILTDALVDRVLLEGLRTTGVRVRPAGGAWSEVRAREVVLSAGAVHSPMILMRSGIGRPEKLGRHGIAVAHALPEVGENFLEHPLVRALVTLRPDLRPSDPDLRHTNVNLTYTSGHGGRRDMMMIAFNHRGFDRGAAAPGGVAVGVFEAESRGEVIMRSADPDADPFVDCNMLSAERDRLRLRDGVRRLARIMAQRPILEAAQSVVFGATDLTMDRAAALPDDALDALMLAEAGDGQHAAGSCRMTAFGNPTGVTNPDGTVKGIAGLRVADASLMPFDCRANTHFTTMAIGEKIAAVMRGD